MKAIKAAGFNTVRLPVGFWAYDNAGLPYISGQAPYVDKAVCMTITTDVNPLTLFSSDCMG